jgi:hypothetical protein
LCSKRSLYQARLGTSIGKTQQKEDGFCRALNNAVQDSPAKPYGSDSGGFQGLNGAEAFFFFAKPFFEWRSFAKTGSGHAQI